MFDKSGKHSKKSTAYSAINIITVISLLSAWIFSTFTFDKGGSAKREQFALHSRDVELHGTNNVKIATADTSASQSLHLSESSRVPNEAKLDSQKQELNFNSSDPQELLELDGLEQSLALVLGKNASLNIYMRPLRLKLLEMRANGTTSLRARQQIGEWLFSEIEDEATRSTIENILSNPPTTSGQKIKYVVARPSNDEMDRFTTVLNLTNQQQSVVKELLQDSRDRFRSGLNRIKAQMPPTTTISKSDILNEFKIAQKSFEGQLINVVTSQQFEDYKRMRDASAFSRITQ